MIDAARQVWRALRALTGDDAYERYLAHWRDQHPGDTRGPLDRRAFFEEEQRRKWDGIRRCC